MITQDDANKFAKKLDITDGSQFVFLGMDTNTDDNIYGLVTNISPQQAELWLKDCNKCNRDIGENDIRKYADDIENDDWHLTPDSIAFAIHQDQNGQNDMILINGQHRLTACCRTKMSILAIVIIGISKGSAPFIDENKVRSHKDSIIIEEKILGTKYNPIIDKENSVMKAIFRGPLPMYKNSNSQLKRLRPKYKNCLLWLRNNVPNVPKITMKDGVKGALGRAYFEYEDNQDMLTKMKEYVQTLINTTNPEQNTSIIEPALQKLRTRMIEEDHMNPTNAYKLTALTLNNYLSDQSMSEEDLTTKQFIDPFPVLGQHTELVAQKLLKKSRKSRIKTK